MEWEYNERTLLIGEVVEVDDSFDHEFGVQKQTHFELKEFTVIIFNFGVDLDITKHLEEKESKMLKALEDEFIERAINNKEYKSFGTDRSYDDE